MRTFALVAGILLIVVGGISLAVRGFSYTSEETVVDAGPIELEAETTDRVTIPRWAAAAALGAGVIITLVGATAKPNA